MVSAIAGRLRRIGLPTDAVVGIQMPNIVEHVLTLLGVLRAGLIAAPLPLLWRRAEAVTALARVGARALVACGRVGSFELGRQATQIAAEVFSIRHVCGFGEHLPDGVVGLDDLFAAARLDPIPSLERDGNAAMHVAVTTFEVGEDGPLPVARRHLEFLAGGLCAFLEGRLEQEASLLSAVPPASFAGLCLTLMPWLLAGGTLVLHHPFDAEVFALQRRNDRRRDADPAGSGGLPPCRNRLVCAGRPDHRSRSLACAGAAYGGGGAGLARARCDDCRRGDFRRSRLCRRAARQRRPADADGAEAGRCGRRWRGCGQRRGIGEERNRHADAARPLVPRGAFPPGIENSDQPYLRIARDGFVDTGFPCRVDLLRQTVAITGPPSGIASVGAYRFPLCTLLATIGRIDAGAALAALPDPLTGQRLVGTAADLAGMQSALSALGANPLVTAAFGERGEQVLREAVA